MSPDPSGPLPGPATPQVNAALRARLEHLLTEYDQMRGNLAQLRQRVAAAEGEAKSQDGSVRVTVGPQGQLRALEITPRAYRHLSPSELAAEIVRLAGEATTGVREQLQEAMAPFLPAGVSYADVASGTVDPAVMTPAHPLTSETVDDWLSRLRQASQRGPANQASGNQASGNQASQDGTRRKAGQ